MILDVVYNHVDGLDLWQFDGWSIDGNLVFVVLSKRDELCEWRDLFF